MRFISDSQDMIAVLNIFKKSFNRVVDFFTLYKQFV